MESWRNRKTLILGRTDMMGLLTPAEYNDCVEHAFRMHGLGRVYMEPKGHIVLDRYTGEWEVMPSYIEEPEAAACKWVSIREDNAQFDLPAVFSILIYTASRDRASHSRSATARYHTLMRTGRVGGRVGEVARATRLAGARDRSAPAASARARSRPATRSSRGTRCASGAARRQSLDRFLARAAAEYPHLTIDGPRPTSQQAVARRRRDRHRHARTRLDRRRRLDRAGHPPGSARRRPGGRAGARPAASCSAARIFVDDIRQCGRTARSTCRCATG